MTTNDTTHFTMGSEVRCSDGVCGKLRRVVVDPVARTVTHLVVEPGRQDQDGRLVPIDLVASSDPAVGLTCSVAEYADLEAAEEVQLLPGARGKWSYEQEQMLSWPYYSLDVGGPGLGMGTRAGMGIGMSSDTRPRTVVRDHVPAGEVQVRRGEHVHATDGAIGSVQGLVLDPRDHGVTHVLLNEGHLWGRKQVAIPIGSVTGVRDGVHLQLTKEQVHDLPPVDLEKQL